MLENTVWRQYHSNNNFGDKIAELCNLQRVDLIQDDKELYGVLKSKLTKKELKLLAMDSAGSDTESLKKEFDYSDEELEKAKFKLYKKLKQDKTRLSFRESSNAAFE
ncbi:hypothetical protein [Sulfurimonas sp.]